MFDNKSMVYLEMVMDIFFKTLYNHTKISLNSLNKRITIVFTFLSTFIFILIFFSNFMISKFTNLICSIISYNHLIIGISCNTKCFGNLFNFVLLKISLEKCDKVFKHSSIEINKIAK